MNNRGFTLIELLAVIVILAIIALIASPIIIGLIDDARKEAFKNSAYGIIKAGEILYAKELLNDLNEEIIFTYTNGVESSSVEEKKLAYNGQKPYSGTIVINTEGKISVMIYNGTYCAEKGYDDSEIILTEKDIEECKIQTLYSDATGAAIPELNEGMIPIIIEANGTVKKADVTSEWYNYASQEWANAVLVSSDVRNSYSNGDIIPENKILAYLVWVPRYRYKLFNVEAVVKPVQTIEIVFEDKNTTKSNGSTNDTWLTHPAFTFGTNELNGIWVGKFETTGNATTPTVKPGISSIRNQSISTQFATAQKFNTTATYGLTSANDAHMIKNMEWGAVTYLTNSIYGKNTEVWSNPSTDCITGCAGTSVSANPSSGCSNNYTTSNGQQASTTGNLYGIYDMSGGALEYVMGGMYNIDNTTIKVNSTGFQQTTIDSPDMAKYIDKYLYGTSTNNQTAYNRRILGDATGEVHDWNGDYAYVVDSSFSWFTRGGYYGSTTNSGLFSFTGESGGTGFGDFGFRIVIIE